MRQIPFNIGKVYFSGIGGIGMSGIAEVMHNIGYQVEGSDISNNANVQRLTAMGIDVNIGQVKENIGDISALVVSTAIREDNPEVVAARENFIPIVRRADMLAELMRLKWCVSVAGTHGKTTTTSMVAAVLDAAEIDPTVINGGIINAYGTNARVGEGDWMVVEADESDGSFMRLPATIAVVTNIDPEHLDHYGSFDAIKAAFRTFIEKVPFYGAAVLCIDHPEVQAVIPHISNRRVVTYGLKAQADVRAINVRFDKGAAFFDVQVSNHAKHGERLIEGFRLPMPGVHNVQNACAAIAVGLEMDMSDDQLRHAFEGFQGVKRRFTHVGEAGGITIIDDYGHHPVEVSAVLKAARDSHEGRIIAVVQPHRYTRLQSLFDDFCAAFNDADHVIVAPVYEAGETPIEGIDHHALAKGLQARGHRNVDAIEGDDELAPLIKKIGQAGDMVVCLGAGNITAWAAALPEQLEALNG